jgi:hypothetical protein
MPPWLVLAAAAAGLFAAWSAVLSRPRQPHAGRALAMERRGRFARVFAALPLAFEPNEGQARTDVRFVAHNAGLGVSLMRDGVVLSLQRPPDGPLKLNGAPNPRAAARHLSQRGNQPPDRLRIEFKGANPAAAAAGLDRLPGVSNYFTGREPAQWRTSIPNYARVKYSSIYPGIDLIFYGNRQGRLEYDFDVAPGSAPGAIRLGFNGAERVRIARDGDLLLTAHSGGLAFGRPIAYQEIGGVRHPVRAEYALGASSEVTIKVGDYDRARPLIVDPAIVYSTYFGGTSAQIEAIAVDAAGEAFVAGWTCCGDDLPTVGAYQPHLLGTANAFVAKFSADGKSLVYSTYLGGSDTDIATGIAVDDSGDAYVAGITDSPDFPAMPAQATALAGGFDAFVTMLNPAGDGLVYSRYVGGSQDDLASAIAIDANGSAYIAGQTFSTDFPVTGSAYQAANPSGGAIGAGFLARIDPPASAGDAAQLYYATYFGGPSPGGAVTLAGIASGGPAGTVYVAGGAGADAPVTIGQAFGGASDAIVADFDTGQSGAASLAFSEFIGGSGFDMATSVATQAGCLSNCPAFVGGYTFSADLDLIGAGGHHGGLEDGFVAEVDPHSGLNYVDYIGGSSFDAAYGVAADSAGDAIATGVTFRPADFPGPFSDVLQPLRAPQGALFISTDGGATFSGNSWPGAQAGSITLNGLAIDNTVTPAIVYAGTNSAGMWRSKDGGQTFAPSAFAGGQVTAVAVDAGPLAGAPSPSPLPSFSPTPTPSSTPTSSPTPSPTPSPSPTPTPGPQTAFAASGGLIYVSNDGGANFVQEGAIPVSGPVTTYFLSADDYGVLGGATNFYVFAGTDHGFFRSTDLGATFTAASGIASGRQRTQVFSGARDFSTGTYYAGTDKGVFISTDNGATFAPTSLNFAPVLSLAIDDSTNPPTVYAGVFGSGVIASTDGFNQDMVSSASLPPSSISYVAIDGQSSNPATVYAGVAENFAVGSLWKSTDAGHTYSQVAASQLDAPCCIFPVAVSNGDIFAGNYLEADAFAAKISSDGSELLAGSYLGGGSHDQGAAVAVDAAGDAYVGGSTYSADFPVLGAAQGAPGGAGNGSVNGFVTKIAYLGKGLAKAPLVINFGKQFVRGSGKTRAVTITNASKTDTLQLGYVRISGNAAQDFQIVSGGNSLIRGARRSAGIPACGPTLAPKSKCRVTITFTPLAAGGRVAALLMPSDSSKGTIATVLIGKGKLRRG